MGVNSLPKTVTRQRCCCDLNSGPTAPKSSTLTTRLPSHPYGAVKRPIIHQRAKFREDWSNRSRDVAIFLIFKMSAAAIFDLQKLEILTFGRLQGANVCHRAKFHQNPSNCCEYVTIWQFRQSEHAWCTYARTNGRTIGKLNTSFPIYRMDRCVINNQELKETKFNVIQVTC